jgi:pimeloyl-ACP methyl ester carboxylesterase
MLPVVLVHGYKYDPTATNENNPHATIFKKWRKQLKGYSVIDYGWFSVPLTVCNIFKSWSNGCYNTYRWAWRLAKEESNKLEDVINDIGECNIIAHSLGTRVALQAIKNKANVHTAIFLNGAEYSNTAANIAELSQTNFHNMYVKTDDVLRKVGRFAPPFFGDDIFIGQAGLQVRLDNWKDYQLDSKKTQLWGKNKGYDLRGDNPDSIGDHGYSHTWLPNWELYRDILTEKGSF